MTDEAAVEPDVDPVIDRLEEIRLETGYDLHRIFRDWMALAVFAFEGNDEEYHDRLDRYARDPHDEETRAEVAQLFSEALGELAAITVEAQRPVVGDVYEQTNNQNEDEGQFFTPWNVCIAKAEMLITAEDAEDATRSDPLRVADPACGSARLLVATAMKLHEIDPDASILVQGTDKDRTCARMAVVNLALGNIPGRIRFGDSLTQEIHEVWHVVPNRPGKPVRRLDDDEIGGLPDDDDNGDDPDHEQQKLITDGGTDQSTGGTERFDECVVCGAEDHDGDGWIFHTSDTEVVGITPGEGLERELKDDARPICSIACKDEFEESDEYTTDTDREGGKIATDGGVSMKPTEDMDHRGLRSEWEEVVERLRNPPASHVEENTLVDRRRELWTEMASNVDAEPPECPECGEASWSQVMGGPKVCDSCDLHLGLQYEDLIQQVDSYWETVIAGPQDGDDDE